jgi:3-dehydroquinate dehydratase
MSNPIYVLSGPDLNLPGAARPKFCGRRALDAAPADTSELADGAATGLARSVP